MNNNLLDLSVHELSLRLSDYEKMYNQLTKFYKKVSLGLMIIAFQKVINILLTFKENILWLDGDEFSRNPIKTLNKVEKFVDVPQYFDKNHFDYSGRNGLPCFKLDEESLSQCMTKGKGRPHPELNEKSLKILREHFIPILEKFKQQTGMNLNLS